MTQAPGRLPEFTFFLELQPTLVKAYWPVKESLTNHAEQQYFMYTKQESADTCTKHCPPRKPIGQ